MEDQGQKNIVSGVETQQVHHCHKCGWPYPKPHPSSKHRRAHKRVCGTLEGYKFQDSSYTIVSDDDHSDDGDYKSPQISFKRLERSPSEDDVYSDAVSNFADPSLNSGVRGTPGIASESASAAEKFSEVVVPEFGASAEGAPAGSLTGSVTVQAPMIAPTIDDESGKRSDSDCLSSTIVAETKPDFPKGAPKDKENDAESLVGLLTENKSPIENDATAEFSPNDEVKVIEQLNDTSDTAESMLQATDEVSTVTDPNDPLAQSVETPNGKLVSETPQKDFSLEHSGVQESEVADFGDVVEHNGKVDKGMHLFHVPHDVPAIEHPEKFIEGFKDHPKKDDVQPDNFDLDVEHSPSVGEYNRVKEEESRRFNVFSLPQDVPVLVNQEKIIEGFKDYEKMGWVGHDNRDFPNAVEEKGEVSCLASDNLLGKDGLTSNPIDQEVEVGEVTDVVHESQQLREYDNLSDALVDGKKKHISDEEVSLEDVTLRTSRENESNISGKSAEEVTYYASEAADDRNRNVPYLAPDSVSVIEATTHSAGECHLSGEVGAIKEEEFSDVVKSLSDTASVLSLDSGAPKTTILDRKDDSNSAFLSSEAPSAVEDGYVSCMEIHHPFSDAVTVTGAEAILKNSAEEQEVSGTVDTRTLNLDTEGDNTISAVVTSEFDGSKKDVEFADSSSSSPPVTEKLFGDIENGTKAAAEESSVQSSLLDESASRSSLDDSIVMENKGVAAVESRRKSTANETITAGGLEAETTVVVVVEEVVTEKEQLKKGDEVEVGDDVDKEAVLLPVGTVSQEPNSLTVVEKGGYGASLQVEDGTKQHHQQLTASVLDASSSRSESLEANWGSVSDTITPTDEPREVGKPNTKQQQATAAPGKLVTSFDEPSLVDSSLTTQGAGADAATNDYYSPGRKKEEMIAKVTNWTDNQPQQHSSPLKNLLVEANRETKPVSPILKENSNDIEKKKDSVKEEDTGAEAKAAAAAISKEWNSPARYPSEIKREKKVKGKPYWAQFVCCSSSIN